jgi:asparagine synthase (glutamine-hydrolysing)
MCGFAGYCSRISGAAYYDDIQFQDNIGRILRHRGPDGSGQWSCAKQGIALVHRRLKIVDVTQAAAQPMFDDTQTIVLAFNGELYNHMSIRQELYALGYRFSSTSDTQTLLYAYKAWGIECIKRFEGMFSFALFDRQTNELYLVRDRIGIKPLYFSLQGSMVSFASEIKALFCLPWISKSIRLDAVGHYLTFLSTPAPMTMYEGIYKLPAGFYLKVDAQRNVTFHEWYSLLESSVPADTQYNEEMYRENIELLLQDSIQKHLMADVPIGIFLSGGIDSSLIACLMRTYTNSLKTFNISFSDGPELQERIWAQKIAHFVGSEHYELIISEREAFTFFEDMVYYQDEPLGDCVCIPLYYVARMAKDMGVSVVQVGEGADELFCGYSTYMRYLKYAPWWQRSQKMLPRLAKRLMAYALCNVYKTRSMTRDLFTMWAADRPLFWGGVRVFSEQCKKRVIEQTNAQPDDIMQQLYPTMIYNSSYDVMDYHRQQLLNKYPHADFLMQMTYLELKHRLPELLLMRVDKMTMATSVEARVPFLDHRLVEQAFHMPQQIKIKNGMPKYVLKKIAEHYVPHDIIYRKKLGFAAPASVWFKTGSYFRFYFADMLHSKTQWHGLLNIPHIEQMLTAHEQGAHDYTYQLWALQNLMSME